MTRGDVERFGRHVLLSPVGDRSLDARGDRFDDGRMEERGLDCALQRVGQRLRLLGHDVEPEDFDGNEAVVRRIICSENRTKSANTYLVQHREGAEGWRRRECAWVLSGQRRNSSGSDHQNVTRIAGSPPLSRASEPTWS